MCENDLKAVKTLFINIFFFRVSILLYSFIFNKLFQFQADWFFPENENEENMPVPVPMPDESEEFESNTNQALLLHNISKYEGTY